MKKFPLAVLVMLAALNGAFMTSAAMPDGIETIEGVEGFANETYVNLFDNDENTKWCNGDAYSYVVWKMPEAVAVNGYIITTANDNAEYPGRNPSSWTLSGSTDGENWEVLDEVDNDTVLKDVTFELDQTAPAYQYYQLEINGTVGGGTMQMSGFELEYEGKPDSGIAVDPAGEDETDNSNADTPDGTNGDTNGDSNNGDSNNSSNSAETNNDSNSANNTDKAPATFDSTALLAGASAVFSAGAAAMLKKRRNK